MTEEEDLENKNYSRLDTLPRILPLKCDIVEKLNKTSKLNRWGNYPIINSNN